MTRDTYESRVPPTPTPPELAAMGYLPTGHDQRRPPQLPSGGPAAIEAALDRLEAVVDEEDSALLHKERADFADINRRKSQSLLELTRLGRTLPHGPGPALRERIAQLAGKLRDNQRTLGLHLTAVREIADLMINALSAAESDGTYAKARPRREIPR